MRLWFELVNIKKKFVVFCLRLAFSIAIYSVVTFNFKARSAQRLHERGSVKRSINRIFNVSEWLIQEVLENKISIRDLI